MYGTVLPMFGFPATLGGPATVVTVDTPLLVAILWAGMALGVGILVPALLASRVRRHRRMPRVVLRPWPPERHAA
jgi:hypothetical protein